MATFGANLRQLRERAGLSGVQLAKRLRVGSSQVSKWEKDRVLPNMATLFRLAKALDCNIHELIRGVDGTRALTKEERLAHIHNFIRFLRDDVPSSVLKALESGAITPTEAAAIADSIVSTAEQLRTNLDSEAAATPETLDEADEISVEAREVALAFTRGSETLRSLIRHAIALAETPEPKSPIGESDHDAERLDSDSHEPERRLQRSR